MTKAKIYLCLNYLTSPHNSSYLKRFNTITGFQRLCRTVSYKLKIEVPDKVRKIVIVKGDKKNGHGNLNFLNGFLSLLFFHVY